MRGSWPLLSAYLLKTARRRLENITDGTEADLRRATSDLYYAMFHRVCEELASPVRDAPVSPAQNEMFVSIYRTPDHGSLERRCRDIQKYPVAQEVRAFAQLLMTMKNKRHSADYDPLARFALSDVQGDLRQVEAALSSLDRMDAAARIHLYVLALPTRR